MPAETLLVSKSKEDCFSYIYQELSSMEILYRIRGLQIDHSKFLEEFWHTKIKKEKNLEKFCKDIGSSIDIKIISDKSKIVKDHPPIEILSEWITKNYGSYTFNFKEIDFNSHFIERFNEAFNLFEEKYSKVDSAF
jgi:hypothetical protein